VRLPARDFHDLLQRGATGALQKIEGLGGLAALVGACRLLLVRRGGFGFLFDGVALWRELALDGATLALCAADTRLLVELSRGSALTCCPFRLEYCEAAPAKANSAPDRGR